MKKGHSRNKLEVTARSLFLCLQTILFITDIPISPLDPQIRVKEGKKRGASSSNFGPSFPVFRVPPQIQLERGTPIYSESELPNRSPITKPFRKS